MRTFEHFPEVAICPLCNTSEDGVCTLISIDNTEQGNICKALPVHVDCITNMNLRFNEETKIFYYKVGGN